MPTLKSLVDETTNIKNEIVNCYDNLKNNLTNKKVDLIGDEKILELVDKIEDIASITNIVAGNSFKFVNMANTSGDVLTVPAYTNSYRFKFNAEGSIRVSLRYATGKGTTGSSTYKITINHIGEDGTAKFTKLCDTGSSTSYITFTVDIDNLEPLDIIELYCNSSNVIGTVKIQSLAITADIV